MNPIKSSSVSTKLPEGWHFTKKYGEVYISPNGTAWTIQLSENQLKSIPVNITSSDIIKSTAIDKVKQAQYMRLYRKSKASITPSPIFTPQELSDA